MINLSPVSTAPKLFGDPLKGAITFLGIRKYRTSLLNNAPIDICREIVKMNFCRLVPANKNITDKVFLELISKVRILTSVDLTDCKKLTTVSVMQLANRSSTSLLRIKCSGDFNDNTDAFKLLSLYIPSINLDAALKFLALKCPNLRSINFDDSKKITDKTLSDFALNCQNLESVELHNCDNLDGEGLIELTEKCKLKSFSLWNGRQHITYDHIIPVIARNCQNLESITLRLLHDQIILFTEHCKKLKSIMIFGDDTSDMTISAMNKNLHDVRSLNLYAWNISDDSMVPFAEKHTKMTHLYLCENIGITDKTLFALSDHCHELIEIDLQETSVTEEGIERLINSCLSLRACYMEYDKMFQSPLRAKYPYIKFEYKI